MNARSELGNRRPTSASIPSANAVSVDIAVPQAPVGACEPAIARKIATGTIIPPMPAATGSSSRRRSRRSPRSNSRRASSPTTKKNNVISPELTQWRRSSVDARAADQDAQRRRPDALVGGADVGPDQRADRAGQQERRRPGLGPQEVAQRRLEVARPGGPSREAAGDRGGARLATGLGRRGLGADGRAVASRLDGSAGGAWLDRDTSTHSKKRRLDASDTPT